MRKRVLNPLMVSMCVGALCPMAAATPNTQTLKGYVTDTWCGANRVKKPPTAECTAMCVRDRHAQYAFFNFADKKVYVLNPQNLAAKYAGETVEVKGSVGQPVKFATQNGPAMGPVITATSIVPATR